MLQQMQKGDFVDFIDVAKPKQIANGGRWHILITEPNREDTAAKALTSRGFAPYSPVVYKRVKASRGRFQEVPRPMFPCYSFVALPSGFEEYEQIKKVPGIFDLMRASDDRRRFALLPEAAISAIRARESAIEFLRQGRFIKSANGGVFEIGQSVTVPVKSAFAELAGKITSVSGKNVGVLLEMEMFGCKREVTVDDTMLIAGGYSQS
jgi:transcription antitermination factor NusG